MSTMEERAATNASAFDILFEATSMVVINKPPNIAMDRPNVATAAVSITTADALNGASQELTVESWAYDHLKARGLFSPDQDCRERAGAMRKQVKFVHQLDYATSGVLCLAFTKPRAAQLAHYFEMRQCRKWYLALLDGHLCAPSAGNRCSSEKALPTGVRWVRQADLDPDLYDALEENPHGGQWDHGGEFAERGEVTRDASRKSPPAPIHRSQPRQRIVRRGSSCRPTQVSGNTEAHTTLSTSTITEQDDPLSAFRSAIHSLRAAEALWEVNVGIGSDTADPQHFRMGVASSSTVANARGAITYIHVLSHGHLPHPRTGEPRPVSKVLLLPCTGRRHQLRVHCATCLGYPILGDTTYATTTEATMAGPSASGWPRMFLHAWRLAFPDDLLSSDAISEAQRVSLKKKRRREVKGIADLLHSGHDGGGDHCVSSPFGATWTEFITSDPFPLPLDTEAAAQ